MKKRMIIFLLSLCFSLVSSAQDQKTVNASILLNGGKFISAQIQKP